MEKRFALAAILSLFVLILWGILNPPPKKAPPLPQESQVIENKDIAIPSPLASESLSTPKPADIDEDIQVLEDEFLKVEFSNIGGNLRRAHIKPFDVILPVQNIMDIKGWEQQPFELESMSSDMVVYRAEQGGIVIRKIYQFSGEYLVKGRIEITNRSNMSKLFDVDIQTFSLDVSSLDKSHAHDQSLYEYVVATEGNVFRKGNATKFSPKEKKEQFASVKWAGFRDRYFCLIFKPEYTSDAHTINPVRENRLTIETKVKEIQVFQGEKKELAAIIYIGPQDLSLLKSYDMGFEEIMAFSNWGFLDVIAKAIYSFMNFLHRFIPNWGVCIIIISVVIYFAMYPLTLKGMMSMKKMQALQPRLAQLRDKHKDNPQKLNKEMMELYREHKINPIGGCLPLILQMPVFVGLYQVLWRSVSFKGAGFLWIKDLSEPDRLMIFPFSIPLIGNELNILPIVMMIVMALQQKVTAKNMVITDPAQVAQQKMMQTVFPIFIGFIFYKFASGLSLYFTIFYLLSTLTQWKMSKLNVNVAK